MDKYDEKAEAFLQRCVRINEAMPDENLTFTAATLALFGRECAAEAWEAASVEIRRKSMTDYWPDVFLARAAALRSTTRGKGA